MYNIFRMNTPTKITLSRIILVALTLIALFTISLMCKIDYHFIDVFHQNLGNTRINVVYFVVAIVFVIAASTDALDGYLARKNNQVTDLGKFLDPVADKLLVNSLLIFLCVGNFVQSYTSVEQYVIPVSCVILMVARDTVVDCLRFVAAKKNVVIAANIFGKAKTVAQMVTIPLVLLNGYPFYLFDNLWNRNLRIVAFFVYVTTLLSLISGVIYVVQNRKVFSNKKSK